MDGALTIGRNVGPKPLNDHDWARFVLDTRKAIEHDGGTVHAVAFSHDGTWSGMLEDNAVVTFANANGHKLPYGLKRLAKQYSQDAIALVSGKSRLVTQ
jgi:hypothetical protein